MGRIDEFRLETERQQSPEEMALHRNTSRQFSLRALLAFVALCLMYCSQFTVATAAFRRDADWAAAATIGTTWFFMALFFYRHRLAIALMLHLYFPVVLGTLCVFTVASLATVARDLAIVGLIANLISFPLALVTLSARAIGRRPHPM